MGSTLVIAEVSQKQAYIFGARKLRDNLRRSGEIEYVTGEKFFKHCWDAYEKEKNLVYTGGGHTVLQFENKEEAKDFCKNVTYTMLREFPDMEMFIHQMEYNEKLMPGENLKRLSEGLETKKSFRTPSFRQLSFGVECCADSVPNSYQHTEPTEYAGWQLTTDFGSLSGDSGENFIAVVHLDGNAMGARVQKIYDNEACSDWEKCVEKLQEFSKSIDDDFKAAYYAMLDELISALDKQSARLREEGKDDPWEKRILPVRKVIGAGDDVCFVTAGQLGIECAVSFLKHLSKQKNKADGDGYAACAGVAMIHTKYPFRVAYDLSEELCSSAKKYGAGIDPKGTISVIDWHIEFGQMKGSLSQIREDYWTEDNGRLELRPFVVSGETPNIEHSYDFFRDVTKMLMKNAEGIARSKVKQLQTALREGEMETKLALRQASMKDILQTSLSARYGNWIERMFSGKPIEYEAFFDDQLDGKPIRRCLYFDSIEVIDHIDLWREGDAQ